MANEQIEEQHNDGILNMENKNLKDELIWAYEQEFCHQKTTKQDDYYQKLSVILERACLQKSEFLLLAWMYAHTDKDYDTKEVSQKVGMSEAETEVCLHKLRVKRLIVFDEFLGQEVDPFQVENYYSRLENKSLTNTQITEDDVFDWLKQIAKDYVKNDCCSFESSRFEMFALKTPESRFGKGYTEIFLKLKREEQKALAFLAGYFLWKGVVPYDYSNDSDEFEMFESLIQKGLAMVYPQEVGKDDFRPDNRIILSPKVCKALFYGHRELIRYSFLSKQAEVIKYEAISEKDLYYEPQDQNIVKTLEKIISEENYQEVRRRLTQKGRNGGISVMLHGGPGVGKTELVKQLARRSRRDIFNVNVSKIYGSLWGETEKNIQAVFRNFKYMASICPTSPILLFNEADGILKTRGKGDGSAVSHGEDIIQTIILQEMEDFEGFFFATTNVANNIDKAFGRRFLFKLEVHSPGPETRAKIWETMIPEIDVKQRKHLAERYTFSGGQIENISRRIDIFEALEGRTPTDAEILNFCEEEVSEKKTGEKIGFVIGSDEEKKEPLNQRTIKQSTSL